MKKKDFLDQFTMKETNKLEIKEATEEQKLEIKEANIETKDITDTLIVKEVNNEVKVEEKPKLEFSEDDKQKIYAKIKEMYTNKDFKLEEENINYFTLGKGKLNFLIDGSFLEPNRLTLLRVTKFEEAFYEQLKSYIYNDSDTIEPKFLFNLTFIYNEIKTGKHPIKLSTKKHKRLLPRIVKVANEFFKDEKGLIASIHNMTMTSLFDEDKKE